MKLNCPKLTESNHPAHFEEYPLPYILSSVKQNNETI